MMRVPGRNPCMPRKNESRDGTPSVTIKDNKMKWIVEAVSNAALNSREMTGVNDCSKLGLGLRRPLQES